MSSAFLTREEFRLNGLWICGCGSEGFVKRTLAHVADWMISLMSDDEVIKFWMARHEEYKYQRFGKSATAGAVGSHEGLPRLDCAG